MASCHASPGVLSPLCSPRDSHSNAARNAFSLAARRPVSGVFTLTFYVTTDQGSKRVAYDH